MTDILIITAGSLATGSAFGYLLARFTAPLQARDSRAQVRLDAQAAKLGHLVGKVEHLTTIGGHWADNRARMDTLLYELNQLKNVADRVNGLSSRVDAIEDAWNPDPEPDSTDTLLALDAELARHFNPADHDERDPFCDCRRCQAEDNGHITTDEACS